MGRKKSAARKRRERLGVYTCTATYHLPLHDLIDVVAFKGLAQADPKPTREAVLEVVFDLLWKRGQRGMQEAREASRDRDLVSDETFAAAEALVVAMFPELAEDEAPASSSKAS